jgi:plastocyanin
LTARRFLIGLSFVLALALLLGVVAIVGVDDSPRGAAGTVVDLRGKASGGSYAEVAVTVLDNTFEPGAIRIDPGVTVSWTNKGRVPHDIRPVSAGGFGVRPSAFGAGDEYEYRFNQPGVYRYYCTLHGTKTQGMTGMVVVGDGDVTASNGPTATRTATGTVHVPGDYPTIQAAVDAAQPGALVLVAPGTYREGVTVTSPDIVIRGEDRNTTIVDGEFRRDNGFKVLADGVAIENFTARNFTSNGFFWTGVTGYRGSYLTAWRNGDYGIYAFDSTKGRFDHSYGAGSPDAGFYIGQCFPCDAVIDHVTAEWNGIGYSGTNAGGNLYVVNSQWRNNRVGIVPNSGSGEKLAPQHGATVAGNVVHDNNNTKTPAIDIAQTALGNGILLAGGNDNVVEHNLVYDHDIVGIGVTPLPEKVLSPDNKNAVNFTASGNRVTDNVVRNSGAADLASISTLDDVKESGHNCFSGNSYVSSLPSNLEALLPCGSPPSPAYESDLGRFASLLLRQTPPSVDYRTAELPPFPHLENMPNATHAPARPARAADLDLHVDVAAIPTPTG